MSFIESGIKPSRNIGLMNESWDMSTVTFILNSLCIQPRHQVTYYKFPPCPRKLSM
ncbi:18471_t:CDS:2, partial [Entrophospora sp. SA101]